MPIQPRRVSLLVLSCVLLALEPRRRAGEARADVRGRDRPRPGAGPAVVPRRPQVLFVLDKSDWKANRRVGHVFRINTDGTGQVQLTFGERGEIAPLVARRPAIAFTRAARRATRTTRSTCSTPIGGEARRVTTHPAAPGNLTWSPDGQADLLHRVRRQVGATNARRTACRTTSTRSTRRTSSSGISGRRISRARRRRSPIGPWSVAGLQLSADGKRVAMTRMPSPLLEFIAARPKCG